MTCSVPVTPERRPAIVMKIPPTLDSARRSCGNGRVEARFLGPFPANHALCKRGRGPIADSETMPHVVDSHWDDDYKHTDSLTCRPVRTTVLSTTPDLKKQPMDIFGYSYKICNVTTAYIFIEE